MAKDNQSDRCDQNAKANINSYIRVPKPTNKNERVTTTSCLKCELN